MFLNIKSDHLIGHNKVDAKCSIVNLSPSHFLSLPPLILPLPLPVSFYPPLSPLSTPSPNPSISLSTSPSLDTRLINYGIISGQSMLISSWMKQSFNKTLGKVKS